jgi:hypothetical protein
MSKRASKIQVCGHRFALALEPENSLAGLRRAISLKLPWLVSPCFTVLPSCMLASCVCCRFCVFTFLPLFAVYTVTPLVLALALGCVLHVKLVLELELVLVYVIF